MPTPPPVIPSGPSSAPQPGTAPVQPNDEMVTFIVGKISTGDGSSLPNDASIQRICTSHVRQQVYANSQGNFSMQMRNAADSFVDATGDGDSHYGSSNNNPGRQGIPQHDLAACELRTSVSGFRAKDIVLAGMTPSTGTIDIGSVLLERITKVDGATVNAAEYKIPKDARKAFEKGVDAEVHGKTENARADFQKAVDLYPTYANAWYRLGVLLDKDKQSDAAHSAYTRAVSSDPKFLPPYLPLALAAYQASEWTKVVDLTKHVMDRDPMGGDKLAGYVVDLDEMGFGTAYFYNAAASYRLNNLDAAESSALKAEHHMDTANRYPQLHLLLADVFAQRKNYAGAINQIQMYLEAVPHAKEADEARAELARLEKLNAPGAEAKPAQQ
jgi:tetratricopeptide (TPR) repeat protein